MDRLIPGTIVVALIVVILLAMWLGWRRRSRRDAGHVPAELPSGFTAESDDEILYVATTAPEQPLERLAVPGLSFRAVARLRIGTGGISLDIPGERAAYIPADDLRGVETARVAIDRAVEAGGMLRISWMLPDGVPCDSYIRVRDARRQGAVLDAITNLIPTSPAHRATESENNA